MDKTSFLQALRAKVATFNVNGMTLGAFTGYFRNRQSTKNIAFSYASYSGHFVLGVIYSKAEGKIDERRKYKLEELENITSVVTDLVLCPRKVSNSFGPARQWKHEEYWFSGRHSETC